MAKKYEFDYDLIVIGSGAGGSAAATIVARAGKKVAIIESDTFGGDSPNWGDIPTKALLHAVNLYDEAKHGARFGLRSSTLGYNYPSIRAWKDLAVKRTGTSENQHFYEEQGIKTYKGTAHFLSPNEITINRRHLSASYFLIATGSEWKIPEIPGIKNVQIHTPKTILESIRPPKSLLVIGGSSVGVEIAQIMSIFGTKVYIIEKSDRILPNQDSEVSVLIERILKEKRGVTTLAHSNVLSIEKHGISKKVIFSKAGTNKSILVDEILIADETEPNLDMGLENAGVKYTEKGILANDHLQTNVSHIFVAGNVLGNNQNTHTSLLESQVVANNILHKNKISPDYSINPDIIFTSPEIATVGVLENNCKVPINKAIAPLNIISRSNTADFRDGFVKVITNKKGVIIGATVVAPHAGEIIHELALAVKFKLTARDLASMPHAFLSWSEAVRVVAGKLS